MFYAATRYDTFRMKKTSNKIDGWELISILHHQEDSLHGWIPALQSINSELLSDPVILEWNFDTSWDLCGGN